MTTLSSFDMQGIGGLVLVVVCYAVYRYRRRTYFLYWTASWLCVSLALLLVPANIEPQPNPLAQRGLTALEGVLGWWHGAWWLLGMLDFHRRHISRTRRLTLLATTALMAIVTAEALDVAARSMVQSGLLTILYGWSVVAMLQELRHRERFGCVMLAFFLALYAIEQTHYLGVSAWSWRAGAMPAYLSFLGLADFLLQTLIAVGMIVVLLDEEHLLLRETLGRLAESEERFRMVFEHGGVGMATLTPEGRFAEVNPALASLFGYPSEELRGMSLAELLDTQSKPSALLPTHDSDARFYERERCYVRKDGRRMWARVFRVPVRDAAGLVRNFVGVWVDITERKQAELKLREERDFSSHVLETADTLIIVLEPDGRIVRFNGKCAAVSGYREDEVRGRVFWDFLLPERWIAPVKLNMHRLLEGQTTTESENPWLTRAGEERLIAWRACAARDADDKARFIIGTGTDITERRKLEEQLRHAQKMEMLGTLVGGIAHDFNNQLAAILGNLSLVLGQSPGGQGQNEALADAELAAQRCADLTRSLLTFSHRQLGKAVMVRLDQIIDECARLLHRVLPATIQVIVDGDRDLWMVCADPTQLHQVLMNLALNARDAMPNGGTLTIRARNRTVAAGAEATHAEARPGEFVELTVDDKGQGMSAEVLPRIFEPFFTTKEVGQGTGLGLAMVYGIVKAHQGWIAVTSRPGEGSSFAIFLPARKQAILTPIPLAPATAPRGHETILVVDDEEMLRQLARTILERQGYRIMTACHGQEALEIYRRQAPAIDLVLLDYTMPKLTGVDVLKELKSINPAVRVIFSSGYAPHNDNNRLLAAGAKAFLPKPYQPAELVRTLRATLDCS